MTVASSISNPTVLSVSVAPLWVLSPNWVFCFLFAKSIDMIYMERKFGQPMLFTLSAEAKVDADF